MRVEMVKQAAPRQTGMTANDNADAERHSESRALVALAPATAAPAPAAHYRQAAYLAHLIAVKEQMPQTCARRRAEPAVAIAAYRAVEAMPGRY